LEAAGLEAAGLEAAGLEEPGLAVFAPARSAMLSTVRWVGLRVEGLSPTTISPLAMLGIPYRDKSTTRNCP
jgi:hypothetical protein